MGISSKIKNLKMNKKRLKPIDSKQNSNIYEFNNNSNSNNNKISSSSIKKDTTKNISINKNNKVSNYSVSNKNNKNTNDVLSTSLLKDREENYDFKDNNSKIYSDHNDSINENDNNDGTENDILKSKGKSNTYSEKMTKNPESFANQYTSKDEEYRGDKTKSVARDYTVESG